MKTQVLKSVGTRRPGWDRRRGSHMSTNLPICASWVSYATLVIDFQRTSWGFISACFLAVKLCDCHGRVNTHQVVACLSLSTCPGCMVTGMNGVPGKQASCVHASTPFVPSTTIFVIENTVLSKIRASPCPFGTPRQTQRQTLKESQKHNTMATVKGGPNHG